MEFRLIYDGELLGASRNDSRSQHKHEVRRVFHQQLKRLAETYPLFKGREMTEVMLITADRFRLGNYRLLPIATGDLRLGCALDVLFLRYDQPGQTLLQSGDVDNRLKTLFDALRIPKVGEWYGEPQEGEDPFFCLLEDDSFITQLSLTTDLLLQPGCGVNDVRLVITVKLWPMELSFGNLGFGY
jgi:hypothetical protein